MQQQLFDVNKTHEYLNLVLAKLDILETEIKSLKKNQSIEAEIESFKKNQSVETVSKKRLCLGKKIEDYLYFLETNNYFSNESLEINKIEYSYVYEDNLKYLKIKSSDFYFYLLKLLDKFTFLDFEKEHLRQTYVNPQGLAGSILERQYLQRNAFIYKIKFLTRVKKGGHYFLILKDIEPLEISKNNEDSFKYVSIHDYCLEVSINTEELVRRELGKMCSFMCKSFNKPIKILEVEGENYSKINMYPEYLVSLIFQWYFVNKIDLKQLYAKYDNHEILEIDNSFSFRNILHKI